MIILKLISMPPKNKTFQSQEIQKITSAEKAVALGAWKWAKICLRENLAYQMLTLYLALDHLQ